MATIFGNKNNKVEKDKSFWICLNCKTENEIGAPFCLRCAQSEDKENVKAVEENNSLFAPLVKALDWYADVAQIKPEEVLAEARLKGVYVKRLEELKQAPIKRLDNIALRFQDENQLLVTGTGVLAGIPGGLLMLATIPADISALTYFSLRAISGISQSYGFESNSEEGRLTALLLFAGASGVESVSIGGSQVVITNLATNVLTKPYRDLITTRVIRQVATELTGKSLARFIPFFGGIVGGTTNYLFLKSVGSRARNHFRMRLLESKTEVEGNPI
ncbi:MAG: EcsC family protein [Chloroflexota bacterium]|nr:EcsC family protein [Chloroflexota bacterium]